MPDDVGAAVRALIAELDAYLQEQEASPGCRDEADPIEPGDPLFEAGCALQRHYPDNRLPTHEKIRFLWNDLLRGSRRREPAAYGHAADLKAALESAFRDRLPQPAAEDGPAPPNLVWWQGEQYDLPPRLWLLLCCLWGRDQVEVQEVARRVWKDEGLEVADSTIRSTLSQLNARLQQIGIPWTYNLKSGYLIKG
jgi:hypothetical protein